MKQVLAVISCVLGLVCLAGVLPAAGQADQVYVVDISGDVDPGMAAFVDRAFREIPDGDHLVVLEMDTFGGRVDAALMIVDTIVNFDRGTTVALVTRKAISAGALIALACDRLAMRPHTTLGDCAPIMVSSEGPEMLGEKFQSPLRAKFRSLARENGYPEVLAEAMVTADMEVLQLTTEDGPVYLDARDFQEWSEAEKAAVVGRKTVVAKGELLTMNDVEARELGFSLMTAADRTALLEHLGPAEYEIVPVDPTWTEGLMRFIGTIAPLLMLIGLGGLYTEIKAPGFGAPGIVGIICLTLFFMNQYTVGLAGYTELLIILLGFVLIVFELFVIPGFGIAGIAGVLFIVVGLVLSLQGFVLPDP
ncbi:MAG: NfeD family protein, partial [Desulfosudaceae bacterium]